MTFYIKGLEHSKILVSLEGPKPTPPVDTEGDSMKRNIVTILRKVSMSISFV